jgi:hypothetical protein
VVATKFVVFLGGVATKNGGGRDAGMLGCWDAEILECWNVGMLGCWDAGMLGCWDQNMMLPALHVSSLSIGAGDAGMGERKSLTTEVTEVTEKTFKTISPHSVRDRLR